LSYIGELCHLTRSEGLCKAFPHQKMASSGACRRESGSELRKAARLPSQEDARSRTNTESPVGPQRRNLHPFTRNRQDPQGATHNLCEDCCSPGHDIPNVPALIYLWPVLLQSICIQAVLVSSRSTFVFQQIRVGQNWNGQSVHLNGKALLRGRVELDATDRGDDVDSPGYDADLKDDPWLDEGIFINFVKWSTEGDQRVVDPSGVIRRGFYPDVHVARRTRVSMSAHGVRADEEKPNSVV